MMMKKVNKQTPGIIALLFCGLVFSQVAFSATLQLAVNTPVSVAPVLNNETPVAAGPFITASQTDIPFNGIVAEVKEQERESRDGQDELFHLISDFAPHLASCLLVLTEGGSLAAGSAVYILPTPVPLYIRNCVHRV